MDIKELEARAAVLEAIGESLRSIQSILSAHQKRIAMLEEIAIAAYEKLKT